MFLYFKMIFLLKVPLFFKDFPYLKLLIVITSFSGVWFSLVMYYANNKFNVKIRFLQKYFRELFLG